MGLQLEAACIWVLPEQKLLTRGHGSVAQEGYSTSERGHLRWHPWLSGPVHGLQETLEFFHALVKGTKVQRGPPGVAGPAQGEEAIECGTSVTRGDDSVTKQMPAEPLEQSH